MKRVRLIVAVLVLSVTGVVARPVEAAPQWRAWQGCNGTTQFGNWVGQGGVSYTGYCYGALTGGHGCSGGPTFCTMFWQPSPDGHGTRSVAIP